MKKSLATCTDTLHFPTAFTLVELMLSLAMVLLLIIGINYVFHSAADAVGAGETLNTINSAAQSTGPMLFDDLRNVSKNPPCFIIASQLVTQFLNSDDAKTSSDPTIIVTDNAGTQVKISNPPTPTGFASTLSPAILNNRNHRADLLEFFAHGTYHRRSGNDGTYFGTESSNDAFIQIGHAALPANDLSNFYGPSSLPNSSATINNYMFANNTVTGVPRVGAYASDWVLARKITLLANPWQNTAGNAQPITQGDYYYATLPNGYSNPVPQNPPFGLDSTTAFGVNMSPLSYGTPDVIAVASGATPTLTTGTQIQSSRYDIAGVTPDQYDRIIANAILGWQNAGYLGSSLWWNPLVYSVPLTQSYTAAAPYAPLSAPIQNPPYTVSYFNVVPTYTSLTPRRTGFAPHSPFNDPGLWLNRPQCNPLIQSPISAAALAEMAPYFLQHCSQFIVEYAGDYLQQDVNGNMTGLGPDGQIDFYLDANGNKHIRWYGMPRSSTGGTPHAGDSSGKTVLIRGYDYTTDKVGTTGLLNYFTDVIPLRDYYTMWFDGQPGNPAPGTTLYTPPWEVDVNFDPTRDYGAYGSTPAAMAGGNNNAFNPITSVQNAPRYVAAWHDDMPAMIRILIKVDDPNNKIKDGPWYEYVFRLK